MTDTFSNLQPYHYLLLAIILVAILVFLFQKTSLFRSNYEIGENDLKINKFPFPTRSIPFAEIRRVTIRHVVDAYDIDYKKITIFGKQKNAHINFEHLREYSKFQQMIEAKGAVFNFKVIHQDTQGSVI